MVLRFISGAFSETWEGIVCDIWFTVENYEFLFYIMIFLNILLMLGRGWCLNQIQSTGWTLFLDSWSRVRFSSIFL